MTQDGGEPQVAFVPAELGAFYIITNLHVTTIYDIKVEVVIHTEGQGELTYDIKPSVFSVTTKSEYHNKERKKE